MDNLSNWKDSVEEVLTEVEEVLSDLEEQSDTISTDYDSLDEAYLILYGIEDDSVDDTITLRTACSAAEKLRGEAEYKRDTVYERISYLEDVASSLENTLSEMDYLD